MTTYTGISDMLTGEELRDGWEGLVKQRAELIVQLREVEAGLKERYGEILQRAVEQAARKEAVSHAGEASMDLKIEAPAGAIA